MNKNYIVWTSAAGTDRYIVPIKVSAGTRAEAAEKRCESLCSRAEYDRISCAVRYVPSHVSASGMKPSLTFPLAHANSDGNGDLYPYTLHVVDRVRGTVTQEVEGR